MLDLRAGVATAISFIFAVIFAYFTNKIFVFKSESHGFLENFKDCMRFFSGRIFTGVLNVVVMEFTVEILGMSESFIFVLCQICVVILNYVLSKYAFKMKPGKSNMSK
jgi:putative flippase GtrA